MSHDPKASEKDASKKENPQGYPQYPKEDDIYNKEEESSFEEDDDPKTRIVNGEEISMDEDLDVPGADLDDEDELIGEEDEENNYYSLDDEDDEEEDDELNP